MEQEQPGLNLADYLSIVNRRKWHFLLPFIVISLIAAIVALKLPASYLSRASILIEDQQIPRNMVQTTITSYADERIQVTKEQVLTTKNIIRIIDKFHLYAGDRESLSDTELTKLFEENTEMGVVAAMMSDPSKSSGGRGKQPLIAFTIGFIDQSPTLAQNVANELVTLFLEENVRVRKQRTQKTTEFLNEEAEKLKQEIQRQERQLAEFKQRYPRSTPEFLQLNLSTIDQTNESIRETNKRIRELQDQVNVIRAQIAEGERVVSDDGGRSDGRGLSKAAQLRSLRAEYSRLSALYTPSHPDIVKVLRQIHALDPSSSDQTADSAQVAEELASARKELEALSAKLEDSHPDVARAKRRIAALEKKAAQKPAVEEAAEESGASSQALTLNAQLKSVQTELELLGQQRETLKAKLAELEARVAEAPEVERAYQDLTREMENSALKYKDLRAKALEAKLAQTLEEEQKGEKFTLLEPPNLPTKPEKPNRPKIFLLGLILGLAGGGGAAFGAEMLDGSIRGTKRVKQLVGAGMLIMAIPVIDTPQEIEQQKKRRTWFWAGAVAALIVVLVVIQFFVASLGDLLVSFSRKLAKL